jgi:hypothetical protein
MSHDVCDFLVFFEGLGFELRLCTYKTGSLLLEPNLQSILLWLFWRWGLENYLFVLALNCNHPDLDLKLPGS